MEQLQAELKGMKEELKNLASVVRSFRTQQDARPRHRATQQETERLRPEVSSTNSSTNSSTKDAGHILIDALSRLEACLEEFDGKIKSALMSTDLLT